MKRYEIDTSLNTKGRDNIIPVDPEIFLRYLLYRTINSTSLVRDESALKTVIANSDNISWVLPYI